ncbi:hypothetical protein QMA02_30160 [Bacillus wiedmannii]|uniref:hypothetical protein n=1 Tax=Bacillus cereus group TaxID=86661 RepID=UPI00211D672B|nr:MULTISPECIES: hypothetical protein [Bacillus cereus group]MDI6680026.1 hypothetical protein [Bacillus wiedmannii]MED1383583.1 hypothetical protein [Bacillus mycoides]
MEILFQCEKCGKENNISDINGTCGNCDNNRFGNFKIIMPTGTLKGMSGMHVLSTAGEMLKSALNKEKIWVIDPKKPFNKRGFESAIHMTNKDVLIAVPLCDVCNGRIKNGVATSSGEHYCGSCYNKLPYEKRAK